MCDTTHGVRSYAHGNTVYYTYGTHMGIRYVTHMEQGCYVGTYKETYKENNKET